MEYRRSVGARYGAEDRLEIRDVLKRKVQHLPAGGDGKPGALIAALV